MKYYYAHKEQKLEYNKEFRKTHKEQILQWRQDDYNRHKSKREETKNIWRKNRYRNDPIFKMKICMSSRVRTALKQKKWLKWGKTQDYIGCTLQELKCHIEKQFIVGMYWHNYGEWQIDHIIPVSSAKTKRELLKLFHYTNLQPLWAKDNLIKGAKYAEEIMK